MLDLGPVLLVENEILEIDVSTIFPPLAPGNLVKLRFETNPGRVRTLGLRFQFDGPEGVQGPQGLRGPQGPQGGIGPAGAQGLTGLQGPQGDQGDKGDTGPPRAKG